MHIKFLAAFISDLNTTAVLFFFFLSGFSICLSLKQQSGFNRETLNVYLYRRFKRIFPLYFFALFISFLAGLITHHLKDAGYHISQLLGNIFFLQCSAAYKGNWFVPYGDNGPLWSLSFEMFYYLFFPLLLFLLLKIFGKKILTPKWQPNILLISFILSLASIVGNVYFFFPYMAFLTLFYIWYAGYYFCELYLHKELYHIRSIYVPGLIFILMIILNYRFHSANFAKLLTGTAIFFFMLGLSYLRRQMYQLFIMIEKLFNVVFLSIGKGSYALYLFHYPLLMILKYYQLTTGYQMVLALVLLTIVCVALEQKTLRQQWKILKRNYV